MLLNTTNQPLTWQLQALTLPVDPAYLYPTKTSNQHYTTGYLTTTPQALSIGTGLEGLMEQKQRLIHARIRMLDYDLQHRYGLMNQNLYEIALNQCTCRNLIYRIGEDTLDKRRIELERKILDLDQERRREQTDSFRDILFLKKELRDSLIEGLEEQQKASIFTNQGEVFA